MNTKLELGGLHHVTAVTGDAAGNVAFYTRLLGLRLVKKTVNQDDVSAYHLFYGDELGRPGTELTFFDWPQSAPNRPGAGTVGEVALRVPNREALEHWARRLDEAGVRHGAIETRAGRDTLSLLDPEGQHLRLVADDASHASAWAGSPVPAEMQIAGLGPVVLHVRRLESTARVLTEVMGFRSRGEHDGMAVFETGAGGPGAEVHLFQAEGRGYIGLGGVHHVAFRVSDVEAQRAWHERLVEAGLNPSPLIDRFYFQSVYFREPGGVLFEIATDGPGFATDEDAAHLGERLSLPPFLEPQRARIEAGLRPLEAAPE